MPGFDGRGPNGLGPLTGRGMGYCALPLSPSSMPTGPTGGSFYPVQETAFGRPLMSSMLPGPGRASMGRGRGFRRGMGHRRGSFRFRG